MDKRGCDISNAANPGCMMKHLTSEDTTGMADNTYNTLNILNLTEMVIILRNTFLKLHAFILI